MALYTVRTYLGMVRHQHAERLFARVSRVRGRVCIDVRVRFGVT